MKPNLSEINELELRKELRKRNQLRKKRSRKIKGLGPRKKGMGCRIGDRDHAAMEARDFQDPGSYIRRDGSEKLVGLDYRKRMEELRQRSGGMCERLSVLGRPHVPDCCMCCADEPHHIVKRSVRRDDRLSNLANLSHPCHKAEDPRVVRSGKVGA